LLIAVTFRETRVQNSTTETFVLLGTITLESMSSCYAFNALGFPNQMGFTFLQHFTRPTCSCMANVFWSNDQHIKRSQASITMTGKLPIYQSIQYTVLIGYLRVVLISTSSCLGRKKLLHFFSSSPSTVDVSQLAISDPRFLAAIILRFSYSSVTRSPGLVCCLVAFLTPTTSDTQP
jgi:hypothetical protein